VRGTAVAVEQRAEELAEISLVGDDVALPDPDDEHWGFSSWNDFFTRRFKHGERPVASPDADKVIVSACESTPYGISADVNRRDRFWIKTQPYSLADMLANDDSIDQFVGGPSTRRF
jgi:phosphatidylserine decarboxylase